MPKTHPTCGSGFRQEAVNLLISSQRPLKAVAAELGVSADSLRTRRDRALHQGLAAQAASARVGGPKGRSGGPLGEPAAEIRRPQRENEYLRPQREILYQLRKGCGLYLLR